MPFRFSLQSLLRFRQSVEQHEQTLLQGANHRVGEMRSRIENLDRSRDLRQQHRRQGLNEGLTGAELQFDLSCDSALANRRRELEKELVELEKLRDQQQEIFRKARLQRETIESIRDRQFREYRAQQLRRDQRSLDDLFLMRREFVRRER